MKIKTIVGSLAALSALVLATVIPAGPASAVPGGSCSIVVPQNVSIVRPYTVITGSLASDCATSGAVFASWDLVHSYYGPSDLFIFDPAGNLLISKSTGDLEEGKGYNLQRFREFLAQYAQRK